jgi:hypothetical protein
MTKADPKNENRTGAYNGNRTPTSPKGEWRRTLVAGGLRVGFDDPFAERNDNVKTKGRSDEILNRLW